MPHEVERKIAAMEEKITHLEKVICSQNKIIEELPAQLKSQMNYISSVETTSKLQLLKDLISITSETQTFELIYEKVKGELTKLDVVYTIYEHTNLCVECYNERKVDGDDCSCCMKNGYKFPGTKIERHRIILSAIPEILSELLNKQREI